MNKFVYQFSEGKDNMRNLLGGKGANLSGMASLGLPVPDGFTVTTEACNDFYYRNKMLSETIEKQIFDAVKKTEQKENKFFGNVKNPLLLAVRSGARVSMPGMMDTILNIGLNDEVVDGLVKLTNNERFAYDSYRRLIMMFGEVVKGVDRHKFENALSALKRKRKIENDADLTAEDFKSLTKTFKEIYKQELNQDFPQNPHTQLLDAVKAVFLSWHTPRAQVYRRMNDIPSNWGTAVNVQTMVFGNMGETSGSGVAFTRNPSSGKNEIYGEYLMNAQGEDVVAGVRTPNPISQLKEQNEQAYNEFINYCELLESHYNDMQELEFTIENGKLYMLQTRNGKRTATASIQIAIDFVNEGKLSKKDALLMIDPKSLDMLLHPAFVPESLKKAAVLASGLPASPGAASGKIALTSDKAKEYAEKGFDVILLREETNPEDIEGMSASKGILTSTGGMTSHAAVVARSIGTACVAGCSDLTIRENGEVIVNKHLFSEGDYISIDGTTGNVYSGVIETQDAKPTKGFETVMGWSDDFAEVEVRANADSAKDVQQAFALGAKGVGLCRTEHMFFEQSRVKTVREMLLAETEKERRHALSKLLVVQREDFVEIFMAIENAPITIRLLDMPLHEFLPRGEKEIAEFAQSINKSYNEVNDMVDRLTEFNPMMGFRGCRLSVVYPEITEMQVQAIMQALKQVKENNNISPKLEIMVPLVVDEKELVYLKNIIEKTAQDVLKNSETIVEFSVGTMIETPRAAILSGEIAKHSEFFSFGTNDLTQLTYGFSRDDIGKFLPHYFDKAILEVDPFVRVDEKAVGVLVENSIKLAKKENANIKIGVCGEHAGDPASISFFANAGVDYVSCSPFRVPIARLSAAQNAIAKNKNKK